MSNTLLRLKLYIDYKGLSLRGFEQSIGVSNGSFTSQLKNGKTIGIDKLENILQVYDELNPDWVLTGRGNMLRESQENIHMSDSYFGELYEVNKKYTILLEEKIKATETHLKICMGELEKLRKE
jgi:cyanate lyase